MFINASEKIYVSMCLITPTVIIFIYLFKGLKVFNSCRQALNIGRKHELEYPACRRYAIVIVCCVPTARQRI